jgi:hypothetical protein
MDLKEKIIAVYPEIAEVADITSVGIYLQDDSDGLGAFIARWDYSKPIPAGLKLGK